MTEKQNKTDELILKGNKLYRAEKYKKALWCYLKAKKLQRDNFAANLNCAETNFVLKKYSKAVYYLKKLQKKYPDNLKVASLLAHSYFELENYEKAGENFSFLTKFIKNNPWNYNYLSQSLQKTGKYEEAFTAAWDALKTSKQPAIAHNINFGYLLYEAHLCKKAELAEKWAEKWISEFRNNPIAQYMGKAILGKSAENSNAVLGIRAIFDAFAPEFEKTLETLEYKTPQLIAQTLQKYDLKGKKILDIGCGTGLCGKYLADIANPNKLFGVDISKNMLQEAAKKKVYHKLFHADVLQYLERHTDEFDLITAGDVLTYFSELSEIFEKAYATLKIGGLFAFSVSSHNQKENFVLHPSGRWQHSPKYVDKLIKKFGFIKKEKIKTIIRYENGNPVNGYIYLIEKPMNL